MTVIGPFLTRSQHLLSIDNGLVESIEQVDAHPPRLYVSNGKRSILADIMPSFHLYGIDRSILNTLLEFNKQYRMSCIFITHTLTNAYYLGWDIILFCRGRAIEKGDMHSIVKKPFHPYTKILIAAIPHITPKERWTDRLELDVTGIVEPEGEIRGCVFYERCRSVTEKCRKQKPEWIELEKNHSVACNKFD